MYGLGKSYLIQINVNDKWYLKEFDRDINMFTWTKNSFNAHTFQTVAEAMEYIDMNKFKHRNCVIMERMLSPYGAWFGGVG
jgi:hypothetical protein